MARSFLAAIRGAVAPEPDLIPEGDEPGADASDSNAPRGQIQENVMADDPNKPAADTGISQAAHDTAVATARSEGEAAGAKAVNDKFSAIVSAEGIKGNATRMAAAIDLAIKSPGMSAEDVTGFVTERVAADAAGGAAPDASLANRIAAEGNDSLGVSDQPDASKVQSGWSKAVAQANGRFGKDAA